MLYAAAAMQVRTTVRRLAPALAIVLAIPLLHGVLAHGRGADPHRPALETASSGAVVSLVVDTCRVCLAGRMLHDDPIGFATTRVIRTAGPLARLPDPARIATPGFPHGGPSTRAPPPLAG